MNIAQILGSLELSFIYGFVTLGVLLSFRILQFPDLTVDGTFSLGAFIVSFGIIQGLSPLVATLLAMLVGGGAGVLTAWMSTRLKMLNLIAGILTMTALYSVNLRILSKPNVALFGEKTIFQELFPFFSWFSPHFFPLLIILFIVCAFLYYFLNTEIGLAIRAIGNNPKMGRANGIHDAHMIWLGLGLSNALVALAGALFTQVCGFADVSMGVGTIIFGLASVILGEALFKIRNVLQLLCACIIGCILYWFVMAMALNAGGLGLKATDKNLVTAFLVAFAISLPSLKRHLEKR